MMDFQLTLDAILRHASLIHGNREVVTRLPDKSWHRYTYADMAHRAERLASGLQALGVGEGDRVATLCWNHFPHLEAYFGVPLVGAVLHTLNLRLHPSDLAYIVGEAQDKVLIVDEGLLPLLAQFENDVQLQHVVVIGDQQQATHPRIDYESLLDDSPPNPSALPALRENQAAAMCYTSGTSGRPKGVLYSHRALTLHTFGAALSSAQDIRESDTVLPVVPMFHANCWGMPYVAAMMGAKLVFAGQHLDPGHLLEAFDQERVTITAGVPTIWFRLLEELDKAPGRYDLSSMRKLVVGGSALPQSMIQAFEERHGLFLVQAWGMTELTPIGTFSYLRHGQAADSTAAQHAQRARQGTPLPLVEIRARNNEGLVPWDGQAVGELEVRGPWIVSGYYERPDASDRFTDDGWFRTGDVASIDPRGCIKIADRAKDLIKSGGEWISSQELENAIMAHPAVAEAAVVAIADAQWDERPLAVVVTKAGASTDADELRAHLVSLVAKWWIPDRFEFVDEIPKTSVGKFKKTALREQYDIHRTQDSSDPSS